MEDDDEGIIFEGSALHEHLKTLNLINATDEHPSFSSHEPCPSQLSECEHSSGFSSHKCQKISWWSQVKFGLFAAFAELKKFKRKFLLIDQLEKEMLSYLAAVVCSKGLLTPDDRLQLYYFSPVFNNLVEEPALINIISDQESRVTSTMLPSISVMRKITTIGTVIAASSVFLYGHSGSALGFVVEDLKNKSYQVAFSTSFMWAPLVVVLLVSKAMRKAVRFRYVRAYKRAKEALLCLASLQSSCLPPAFSAAAEAALLLSPSTARGAALGQRLELELSRLRCLLRDTLNSALVALVPQATHSRQSQDGMDEWMQTKAIRRDLELHTSALARDVLLRAEKSNAREPLLLDSTSQSRANVDGGSVFHVMETLCSSLAEVLPEIQALSRAVNCQVGLLRHCWLYAEEDTKPQMERACEEVSSAISLTRRMQSCLLLLDQMIPDLKEFSSISLPESSEGEESVFREMVMKKYDDIQDKIDLLSEEFKLGQQDLVVVSESLATRKLRLIKEPKGNWRLDAEARLGRNASKNPEQSTIPELHVVPVTPYVAEDEFFEATTEDLGDHNEEAMQWDAENEQDEQIRRQVIACNKRVLSELQPILVRKKEEFKEREEKAKKRMKAGLENDDSLRHETQIEDMITSTSNDDEVIDDEILNVVDASSALRNIENRPLLNNAEHSFQMSNSAASCSNQPQTSVNISQLEDSPEKFRPEKVKSQPPVEESSDGSQLRFESTDQNLLSDKNTATGTSVELNDTDSGDQLLLTEYNSILQVEPDLHKGQPCRDITDHCSETNHGSDIGKSNCGSTGEKILSPHVLSSCVCNENLNSGNNINGVEDVRSDSPSNSHTPQNTIFETSSSDSGVRKSQVSDYNYVERHEEFESSPGQSDEEGDSRWNIPVRPRDLKERLRLMMENQRRELDNSDRVSSDILDPSRSSEECSWGFPSSLAAEAVRLSNVFGVQEETFGGMGEGDEEFNDGIDGKLDDNKYAGVVKEEILSGSDKESTENSV